MPKIKTHKGIAKRVKKTGNGKLKVNKGFSNHFQTKRKVKERDIFAKKKFLIRHMKKDINN